MSRLPGQVTAGPSHAVLLMTRVVPRAVPWVLARLARGPAVLGRVPGLRFARVLGSGRGGGFGLAPGWDCQGIFAAFDHLDDALQFALGSPTVAALRERSLEQAVAVVTATRARGAWAGQTMAADPLSAEPAGGLGAGASGPASSGPVAALTRAAIRLRHVRAFWAHSPPSERDLAEAPGCRLAVGLGEAPLLRQATFSVWDSESAMDAYARHGAHQRAIDAAWQREFFSEWMFVRFRVEHLSGSWGGHLLQAASARRESDPATVTARGAMHG